MAKSKIALIVGSNRRDSLNRKLGLALSKLGEDQFDFTFIRIDDLPIYNQDLEKELPASVVRFKSEIESADALLFVTPEYNRSIPALLKNAIEWGSRPYGRNSWAGKPSAVTGTTLGAIGTAVAQAHLRQVLSVLSTHVMGGETYITFKPGLVDEGGYVTDESTRTFLQNFLDQFATFVSRLAIRQAA